VSDPEGVNIFDDLFFLRVEHLPVPRIGRLIQESAVGGDSAILRLGAETHGERLDDFVANRVDQRHHASNLGGDIELVL